MLEKKEMIQNSEEMRNKKDRKRPELQIYRPGMGLQNKSSSKSDESVSSSRSNSLTTQHENSSNEIFPHDKDNTFTNNKSSQKLKVQSFSNKLGSAKSNEPAKHVSQKNSTKNRRPDIQVYVPKPKAIAKLNELSKSRSSSEICESPASDVVCKSEKSVDRCERSEDTFVSDKVKDRSTHSPDFKVSNRPAHSPELRMSSRPVHSPELKVSNYNQGMKEKLHARGRKSKTSVCENIANSFKLHKVSKPGSLNSCPSLNDNMKSSAAANRKKGDPSHGKKNSVVCLEDETEVKQTPFRIGGHRGSSSPEVSSNGHSRLSGQRIDNSCKSNKKSERQRSMDEKSKNSESRKMKTEDSPASNKALPESGSFGKMHSADANTFRGKIPEAKEFEKYKMHGYNHSHKVRQDHNDYQQSVQKSLSSDCVPDERTKGGGILRLPRDSLTNGVPIDRPVSVLTEQHTLYEPLVIVQQKHLYNPNNPDVPEIVSVPTHMNGPCSPSERVDYFCPELSPGSLGYIPPPQPSSVMHQYPYEVEDFPSLSNSSSRNLNVSYSPRSVMSPVQCSIPSPTPPPVRLSVIPSPTAPFLGARPEIIPSPAPRLSSVYNNQLVLQDTGKKRVKPIVEKNLLEINMLERHMSDYLSDGLLNADLKVLNQCRWKLQLRYENIILADPRYCAEKNVEQSLWKSAYYQIIESLRKSIEDQPQRKEELTDILINVVHEGTVFYENLLEKQQETFGFNLSHLLEVALLGTNYLPESIRLVLISCQKILIYLGDLARYREQANETTNYGKARSWYLKAQQIAPKNGRPYNQLAIVALHTKRKLDAVYYYMRSLAASNPFLSARECLLSLFDEAKRKFEHFERKRAEDSSSERENNSKLRYRGERCEVWIKPDGSKSQQTTQLVKGADEFEDLSSIELNKRFVVSFLHVHGKLFTKVGMETFVDAVKRMLKEFHHLLQRTPSAMRSSRLLQLMAVNMFSVENATLKDLSPNSLLQEHALNVILAMVSLIMERCCSMYEDHLESPEYPSHLVSDDLAQLLPAVKVWTDWMSCQRDFWKPPFVQNKEFRIGYEKDVWFSFAKLLTTLRRIDTSSYEIALNKMEGYEPLVLEEDASLSGFVPLLGASIEPAYVKVPFEKNNTKNSLRISRIQFFGDYLCGIATPYLEFDVEHKKFISLVDAPNDENLKHPEELWENSKDDVGVDGDDEDKVVVSVSNSEDIPAENEIQMLWSRKEALHKAREQQEHYKAQVQVNETQTLCAKIEAVRKAFLQLQNYSTDPLVNEIQELQYRKEALVKVLSQQECEKALCQAVLQNNQNQHPIVLQIQPKYLIPDTNCFIDHLQIIKDIANNYDFVIVVPLVVINELDGLAHGTRVNPHISPEHANKVTMLSREAITFLENEFSSRNPQFRAITSKGSVLDTISFRNEDMSDNKVGTNDDLILACCLYYCKDNSRYPARNSEGAIHVFREVVLLTDDRNLRVKALTHNVPARNLISFLSWVKS